MYSVTCTHDVHILVIGTIFPLVLHYSVTHEVRILVIGAIFPLAPDTVLHTRCAYLGHWNNLSASTRYSVTCTHDVHILVIGTIFPLVLHYSVTHEVRILVIGAIFPLVPDTVLHTRCAYLGHWNNLSASTRLQWNSLSNALAQTNHCSDKAFSMYVVYLGDLKLRSAVAFIASFILICSLA